MATDKLTKCECWWRIRSDFRPSIYAPTCLTDFSDGSRNRIHHLHSYVLPHNLLVFDGASPLAPHRPSQVSFLNSSHPVADIPPFPFSPKSRLPFFQQCHLPSLYFIITASGPQPSPSAQRMVGHHPSQRISPIHLRSRLVLHHSLLTSSSHPPSCRFSLDRHFACQSSADLHHNFFWRSHGYAKTWFGYEFSTEEYSE